MERSPPKADTPAEFSDMDNVLRELLQLREEMLAEVKRHESELFDIDPAYQISAENLLHYLVLRRHDIRSLQQRLSALGLSSLGRSEACVLASINAVVRVLEHLLGKAPSNQFSGAVKTVDILGGGKLLSEHTERLLGPSSEERDVRIMVTMPTEAASDYRIVHDLLAKGMNCMRINCAHDSPDIWAGMVENLRKAETSLRRKCRVFMDLSGPKLRTGEIEPGPPVVHIRPERDAFGLTIVPARIWLTPEESPHNAPYPCEATFTVPGDWLKSIHKYDEVGLVDTRGSSRTWSVIEVSAEGCWVESIKGCFIVPGTELHIKDKQRRLCCRIGEFAPRPGVLLLHPGDPLIVTADPIKGHAATHDTGGRILTPATISCTLPEVVSQVRPGEAIWLDDGKIGGVIETVDEDRFLARITHAKAKGSKLRSNKGINLPDSKLELDALTSGDISNLPFIVNHADVVEMSFVNSAQDVAMLERHLGTVEGETPAIVLKVETRRGFENLPQMLLAAMRWPSCGVMIARGDLAVECGFERLAEAQEEILWVCEAAHIPVIWATQVLENLAQKGMPSRAEITDAAMGHRAECVMLNKGPHIVEAVAALDDILKRMQSHQSKKRSMLRELHLAHMGPTL